jgi:hypothetical protein
MKSIGSINPVSFDKIDCGGIFISSDSRSGDLQSSICLKGSLKVENNKEDVLIRLKSIHHLQDKKDSEENVPVLVRNNNLSVLQVLDVSSEIFIKPDYSVNSVFTREQYNDASPIGALLFAEKTLYLCVKFPTNPVTRYFVNINTGEVVAELNRSIEDWLVYRWSLVGYACTIFENKFHKFCANISRDD